MFLMYSGDGGGFSESFLLLKVVSVIANSPYKSLESIQMFLASAARFMCLYVNLWTALHVNKFPRC